GRVGHTHARPKEPHVVVDLGDGADGGAWIARGGLLLDRDRRREAVDLIDVRLLHHLQELARIGGQRLNITALAFGIDGVEGERGFARARQPGEHHELIARDLDVDVFQVVLARTADRDHAAIAYALVAGARLGTPRLGARVGTAGAGLVEQGVRRTPFDGFGGRFFSCSALVP